MKIERRTFRIGYLSKKLQVDTSVIRFWEKEFNISAQRTAGGQRYYHDTDVQTFIVIKKLLYEKCFTITGAKKYIQACDKKELKCLQCQ